MAIHHASLSQRSARLRRRQYGQFTNPIMAISYCNSFSRSSERTFQDLTNTIGIQPSTLATGTQLLSTRGFRTWEHGPHFGRRTRSGNVAEMAALGLTMDCDQFERALGSLLGTRELGVVSPPSALQQLRALNDLKSWLTSADQPRPPSYSVRHTTLPFSWSNVASDFPPFLV